MAHAGLATDREAPSHAQTTRNRFGLLAWFNGYRLSVIALVSGITLTNLTWVVRDRTTPSWDQSHYLTLTLIYRRDLDQYGLGRVLHDMHTIDPGRGQMLSLLMIPIAYFTHDQPNTGLILNLILWPILLLSTGAIAAHFYGQRARLLAIVLIAPMPLIVSLADTVLQDFLLVTLASVGIWALLRTRGFSNIWASAGLGLIIMIGSLTKISYGVALAVPLLVVLCARAYQLAIARRAGQAIGNDVKRSAICLTVMVLIGGLIPVVWYMNTWSQTVLYLHAAFDRLPGTIDDPTSLHHVGEFSLAMLNQAFSWQITIVALLVVIGTLAGIRRLSPSWSLTSTYRLAFLGSFALVPFLAVVVSDNHGIRYAVSTLPAFAVIVAGGIAGLRWRSARYAVSAVLVVAATTATLQVDSSRWNFPGLSDGYALATPFGDARIQLAHGLGPAGNYLAGDYGSDMMNYLVSISRDANGVVQPRTIVLLELQSYVNGNTMPYEALLRHVPFTFVTVVSDGSPTQQAALTAQLKISDIALYLSQPAADKVAAFDRVAQLNDTAAARHLTPAMFALFQPNPHGVYVGADSGQGDHMYVLVRKR